jgi:transposase
MELSHYETIVKSEDKAFRYLSKKCRENGHRFCPKCTCRVLWKLGSGRRRCSRCRYTFTDFSGRWLNQSRLSCQNWLRVLKLFELEVSANKIASPLAVPYNTVHRAVMLIRHAILCAATDAETLLGGEIELDESYFGGKRKGKRGRGAAGKVPVFGILERQGIVRVEVVPNVRAETLLGLTVKTVRRGSIVYTDRYQAYDSLMFCGYRHLSINHQKRFATGKVYINGLEGFWSWAKERLIKHHGISPTWFPFYLKELEFRYNHRHDDIFELSANTVCSLIPNIKKSFLVSGE